MLRNFLLVWEKKEYENTRHNVGFFFDYLAHNSDENFPHLQHSEKFHAEIAEIQLKMNEYFFETTNIYEWVRRVVSGGFLRFTNQPSSDLYTCAWWLDIAVWSI